MICPYCANDKTEVLNTIKGLKNERFRRCQRCHKSWKTIEAIEFDDYWKEYAKAIEEPKEDNKDER